MSSNGPTEHLSWKELACHDGTPYPQKFIDDGRIFQLAAAFESIRKLLGDRPIIILSAYRTKDWNERIGGAPHSQHIEGRALDLRPPAGINVIKFHKMIKDSAREFGIHGIGLYKTFVHIDIRPNSKLVTWSTPGLDTEVNA